ncbi:hypothetical protein dsmv_3484 [Desulfococcus multivorans DSM 2059]|uniref:Uncharacterized protein n=1 Tax=Desulfococcus multivorans DSM 2059 TaxID=1121405 RepID=S7TBX8_DESML|nr:hypothetical protein dsmv_3484 [Desulfococcus multivorans DSM 2059]
MQSTYVRVAISVVCAGFLLAHVVWHADRIGG